MEEPLPDWLKVYQQNSTKKSSEEVYFPSESESDLATVSELDEFINTEKSEEDQLREQIRKDFPSKLRLRDFIREIIPVAEENNVKMALHPDDPPIPLFGVPRIVSTYEDYKYILNSYNSESNGITFCSGSLASNVDNDIYKIFNKFKDKVNFIHLRNVKIEKDKKSFYESNHLDGDVDFVKLIKMILKEEKRRSKNKKIDIPMRPDHGHALLDDQKKKTINPGYTAIGRLMGLSELRGIIKALQN